MHLFDEMFRIFEGMFITVEMHYERYIDLIGIIEQLQSLFSSNCQMSKVGNIIYIAIPLSGKQYELSCAVRKLSFENTFQDFSNLMLVAEILENIENSIMDNSKNNSCPIETVKYCRANSITLSKKKRVLFIINIVASAFIFLLVTADYLAPFTTITLQNTDAKFNGVERSIILRDNSFNIYSEYVIALYSQVASSEHFYFYQTPIFNVPMYMFDFSFRIYSLYNYQGFLLILLIIPIIQWVLMTKNKSLSYPFFAYSLHQYFVKFYAAILP